MTIEQLRAQIVALQNATMDENRNFRSAYDEGKFDALTAVDALLDSMQEEPVRNPIDFEKELYKAFGQVKDFTLGMRIAKWFYDMGMNSQEPVSEDLEEAALFHYPKMSRISEPHDIIPADNESHYIGDVNEDNRKAFKAGAKWQLNKIRKKYEENRD